MALLKPNKEQTKIIKRRLTKWYNLTTSSGRQVGTTEAHRMLFAAFADVGVGEVNISKGRASIPDYASLGMKRKACSPTEEDIARYAEVTGGGKLTKDGLIVQALMFDNDLITDRSAVMSFKGLTELCSKYMGRANDFNHSFNVQDARCRIIDLGLGYDPNTQFHPDRPTTNLGKLPGATYYDSVYTALHATLAFPYVENDQTIDKVLSGLIKDESVAFATTPGTEFCSECLTPLTHSFCYTQCDEHGYVGGRVEDTGSLICNVMTSVADAFTFGLVSDGAIARAGIVLNPTNEVEQEEETSIVIPDNNRNYTIVWQGGSLGLNGGTSSVGTPNFNILNDGHEVRL